MRQESKNVSLQLAPPGDHQGAVMLEQDMAGAQDTIYLCNFRVSVDGDWLCLKELQDVEYSMQDSMQRSPSPPLALSGIDDEQFHASHDPQQLCDLTSPTLQHFSSLCLYYRWHTRSSSWCFYFFYIFYEIKFKGFIFWII